MVGNFVKLTKTILLWAVIVVLLIITLYYPIVMKGFWPTIAELTHTVILPETSIPIWLHIFNLDRIDTFILVTLISRIPVIIIFWPNTVKKLVPKIIRSIFFEMFIFLKGCFIKLTSKQDGVQEKFFKINLPSAKKIFLPLLTFLLLFTAADGYKVTRINWHHWLILIVAFLIISVDYLVKIFWAIQKWALGKNGKLKKIMIDLGYMGVIIGAMTPFVPGMREAGIASALFLKKNKAKILYNMVDVLRNLIEVILF